VKYNLVLHAVSSRASTSPAVKEINTINVLPLAALEYVLRTF
jgi:hypothetical protein